MNRVAAQERIVFFDLQLFRLQFFISCSGVARRRLTFLARFRAFDGDNFSRHKNLFLFLRLLFRLVFVARIRVRTAGAVHTAQRTQAALPQSPVAFELRLRFHGEARPRNRLQTSLRNVLRGQFWPTTIAGATDSVAVTLYARDMDGSVRNVSVATTFAVAVGGSALAVRSGGVTVTSVTIPVDAQFVTFYLRRLANGTATVTFTNANYTTQVAPVVTVSGAP